MLRQCHACHDVTGRVTPGPGADAGFRAVYLLRVSLSEGQFGGDVEHDLLLSVDGVDGLRPRLAVGHIQTPPKPAQREGGPVSVYFLFLISCLSGGL